MRRIFRLIKLCATVAFCSLFLGLSGCGIGSNSELPKFNPMGTTGIFPRDAEIAFAQAHVLWEGESCSDPDKAVILLTKAIDLAPKYSSAYLYRGLAYSEQKRFELALEDLTQGLRLRPDADMYAYRGLIFMRMQNLLGAREDLNRAIELNPDSHRAYNFRAAVNLLDNRYQSACDDWEEGCSNGDCTGLENARTHEICE